jgi:hypothetical protein
MIDDINPKQIIELAIGEAREYNELLKRTYFD